MQTKCETFVGHCYSCFLSEVQGYWRLFSIYIVDDFERTLPVCLNSTKLDDDRSAILSA